MQLLTGTGCPEVERVETAMPCVCFFLCVGRLLSRCVSARVPLCVSASVCVCVGDIIIENNEWYVFDTLPLSLRPFNFTFRAILSRRFKFHWQKKGVFGIDTADYWQKTTTSTSRYNNNKNSSSNSNNSNIDGNNNNTSLCSSSCSICANCVVFLSCLISYPLLPGCVCLSACSFVSVAPLTVVSCRLSVVSCLLFVRLVLAWLVGYLPCVELDLNIFDTWSQIIAGINHYSTAAGASSLF